MDDRLDMRDRLVNTQPTSDCFFGGPNITGPVEQAGKECP
jgi:hypothetical protein